MSCHTSGFPLALGFLAAAAHCCVINTFLLKIQVFNSNFFFFGEYYSQLVCLCSFRLDPGSAKADTPSELFPVCNPTEISDVV